MRRLTSDRRAGVAVLVGGMLPVLLGAAAAAVDVGAVALERRRMQGAVDAAALAAAQAPSDAATRARQAIAANRPGVVIDTRVTAGIATRGATGIVLTPNPAGDAVQVSATYPNDTYFLRALGLRFPPATVTATAARRNLGALSIGSGLASFENGVVNGFTRAMTGSSVGLSLLGYQGLASANVDLFAFLDAVALRANLGAISYDSLLDREFDLPLLLRALGDASGSGALEGVAAGIGGSPRTLRLGDLIGLDLPGAGNVGGGGQSAVRAQTRASDLLGAMLALANRGNAVSLDLGSGIAGLSAVRAELRIGEAIQSSPWMIVNERSGIEVNTAQARINLVADIGPLLGFSLNLPLAADIAQARAVLDALPCAPRTTAAVRARAGVARVAVAAIPIGQAIPDGPTALPPAPMLRAPLLEVDGRAFGALEASDWQPLSFTREDIAGHVGKSVATTDGVSTLIGSTLASTRIDVRFPGLGLGMGLPGQSQVASAISAATPGLERTLFDLLTLAGLQIGTAKVWIDGYRCGHPVLIG
ncbi:pilus assembly protein TadG-related protein [Sphingomonas sp.]|uniref:pilus assembly protein TadG-related protein n=1 Tax=Sphingomonas sp. TaxID=28214 RepID=UPI0025DC627D|nr:pilus assembly protein TadG-related protein [Sphingomonas sp.]